MANPAPKIPEIHIPEAFEALFLPYRFKAYYGGRGSGKSHSFARALVVRCLLQPTRALCLREIQKSIKDSVYALLRDVINELGLGDTAPDGGPGTRMFRCMETEIRAPHGGLIMFAGMKNNPDTIKSLEGADIAWGEEANKLSQNSLDKLIPTIRKRSSELWFSWNPELPTDPVDAYFRGKDAKGEPLPPPPNSYVREVNYEENPWFTQELREAMQFDRRRDPDKYAHIWLGQYLRNSEARVFRNWAIEHFDIPDRENWLYGSDFGFSIDPTVLVKSFINHEQRKLYICAAVARIGVEIDRTPQFFDTLDNGEARKWPCRADGSRPETISYLNRHNYPRIVAARKGPGSVEEGIEFLKNYDIVVHPSCPPIVADELTMYSYKTDPLTGDVLPILQDKKNHVIDAIRYSVENVRRPAGEAIGISFY